jgi:hypothetical protein
MKLAITATRVLSIGLALAALSVAFGGVSASAQTPNAYLSACSTPASAPPAPTMPSDAQIQQLQAQFAQGLAQSLSVSPSAVQQALSGLNTQATQPPVQFTDPLQGAASQLNVSFDSLRTAVQSADQSMLCAQTPSTGGNAFFLGSVAGGRIPVDPAAFFAAVAQNLGGGLSGPQVQSAFASTSPALPDAGQMTAQLQSQLDTLASALGVSIDSLKSALKSLGSSGSCLPPNTLGGFRIVTRQAGSPPPQILDGGPIIIPLGDARPSAGLPGNAADPLGLGIAPCGFTQMSS